MKKINPCNPIFFSDNRNKMESFMTVEKKNNNNDNDKKRIEHLLVGIPGGGKMDDDNELVKD